MSIIRLARKIVVLVVGVTVLLIGMAMIVLPGPAIIVIPVGLAILGTEFLWARRLLHLVREEGAKLGTAILHAIFPGSKRRQKGDDVQSKSWSGQNEPGRQIRS